MNWDVEFNELYGVYQLVIEDDVTLLAADDYELALDEAGEILDAMGFYEEEY